jgi:NAD(P)-dependent dehydrogenase (short-subunit alcohol dehydrogenase family)
MIDLKGKVAIVTAGCSGIGRGTVTVLRRAGARVACLDVQDEKGQALARELGESVLYVHADVTSEDEVAAAPVIPTSIFGRRPGPDRRSTGSRAWSV